MSKDLQTKSSNTGEDGVPPRDSIYEKPLKQKAIKDNTGWKLRPENKMIMTGSLAPADEGNTLLPEGLDQPKSNKAKS